MNSAAGSTAEIASTDDYATIPSAWHHLAVVFDAGAADQVLLYTDGVLDSSTTTGGNVGSLTAADFDFASIGGFGQDGGAPHARNNLVGAIDDVQIYDGALSAELVAFLHSNPGAIITDMYALYQFEDASGTEGSTIADSSPSSHDATVSGGNIDLVAGKAGYGNAGDFAGTSAFVSTGPLPSLETTVGDFGVALWMKAANLTGNQYYLTARSDGGGGQFAVLFEYVDDQVELFRGSGGPDTRPSSQITIPDTAWHHIVYTRTGTDYDFYLDGVKTDIGTLSGNLTGVDQVLRMGYPAFAGLLDDVAWFRKGLDQTEVNAIMSGDFSAWGGPKIIPTQGTIFIIR